MRILFLLIINLSFISVLYSTATIKGTIKNFSGQTGKVFKYLDFVSYEQQQIADFQIDANGYFEFELDIEPNSRIRINLNEKDSRLYVQQNGIYTFGLKPYFIPRRRCRRNSESNFHPVSAFRTLCSDMSQSPSSAGIKKQSYQCT